MNLSEYRTQIRLLLGDINGRRYADDQLDLALKQALETASSYLDERNTIRVRIKEILNRTVVLNMELPAGVRVLAVRWASNHEYMHCSIRSQMGKTYLDVSETDPMPAAGDQLDIELPKRYRIDGLTDKGDPFPDNLSLTLTEGAAGYAMLIRARSVTEVFGKRPEDRAALTAQGQDLIRGFVRELDLSAAASILKKDPWALRNFPI